MAEEKCFGFDTRASVPASDPNRHGPARGADLPDDLPPHTSGLLAQGVN